MTQATKVNRHDLKILQAERRTLTERAHVIEFRKRHIKNPGLFRRLLAAWRHRDRNWRV